MGRLIRRAVATGACVIVAAACGGDSTAPPLQVPFGQTTLVVLVNPVINDGNATPMPTPGSMQSGVTVSVDQGPSATTDASGVVVLGPVQPGARTLSLSGGGQSGTVSVSIADKDLKEVAVALTASGAAVMREVLYAFGGQVVEVTPTMTAADVNAQLAMSNTIVFFRGGIYTGDLTFGGSNVTLFGQGERGGQVTIQGNVVVDGSRNRIRGARITGNLTVGASDAGISFSRVNGTFGLAGSSGILLSNGFCGTVTVGGSDPTLLANAGIAPLAKPGDC